jgi:parallel beta-helix repeat protein
VTDRLIARGNFVHHNFGPGLWTDIDNINTLYENNTVEDNEQMGIFHEISYAAVIRNNIVRRNGFGFTAWIWGSGILIAASPNVEVYGNTVEGNAHGIGAVQQNRGSGAFGAHEISNLYVHDNLVSMSQGQTGLVQDIGDTSYFTSRNNRFDRNQYHLGSNAYYFTWMNGSRNETQWKGYGLDVAGSFVR